MIKFKKKDLEFFSLFAVSVIVLGIVFWVGSRGVCYISTKRAISRAEKLVNDGYSSVAAEVLDDYRVSAVRQDKGCPVIIAAYLGARRLDRLEWAGEACIENGHATADAYLGLSAVRELTSRDQEALQLLAAAAGKFDKMPDIYQRIAIILRRNKNVQGAEAAYSQAIARADNNKQVIVDAMEFFVSVQHWEKAKEMALRIKDIPTENLDIKAMTARVFKKSGDESNYTAAVGQIKDLLNKRPATEKTQFEQANTDLFATNVDTSKSSHKPASAN